MRREELDLDDGLLCLSINGKSEIIFNPTDYGFIERLVDAFEQASELQSELERKVKSSEPRAVFDIARDFDGRMRQLVDAVAGAGTCDAQFGAMNVYAYADGLPVWCNLLFAILDRCESDVVTQQKQMHPRLEKYAAKYKKK